MEIFTQKLGNSMKDNMYSNIRLTDDLALAFKALTVDLSELIHH